MVRGHIYTHRSEVVQLICHPTPHPPPQASSSLWEPVPQLACVGMRASGCKRKEHLQRWGRHSGSRDLPRGLGGPPREAGLDAALHGDKNTNSGGIRELLVFLHIQNLIFYFLLFSFFFCYCVLLWCFIFFWYIFIFLTLSFILLFCSFLSVVCFCFLLLSVHLIFLCCLILLLSILFFIFVFVIFMCLSFVLLAFLSVFKILFSV